MVASAVELALSAELYRMFCSPHDISESSDLAIELVHIELWISKLILQLIQQVKLRIVLQQS